MESVNVTENMCEKFVQELLGQLMTNLYTVSFSSDNNNNNSHVSTNRDPGSPGSLLTSSDPGSPGSLPTNTTQCTRDQISPLPWTTNAQSENMNNSNNANDDISSAQDAPACDKQPPQELQMRDVDLMMKRMLTGRSPSSQDPVGGISGNGSSSSSSLSVYKMRITVVPPPKETLFFIGGTNGAHLVEPVLLALGWKKTTDKTAVDVKLRWVEVAQMVDYQTFKEGEHLVNRIPNCYLLSNKLGLLNSVESYERVMNVMRRSRDLTLLVSDFFPETYRVDDLVDRRTFFGRFKDGDIWICKPVGMNQGKGIYLVRNLDEFKKMLEEREDKTKQKTFRQMDRIIQRYLTNPLLLEGRKFDIRCYMLIACMCPYLVLYHRGYIRRSLYKYDNNDRNLLTHLTNQYIQKRDPSYNMLKEDTIWSMDKFNEYFNEKIAPNRCLDQDWVYTVLTPRMKHIMLHCFKAVKHKLQAKLGFFDLYGLDFILDDNLQLWLLEFNSNPNLATNCQPLKELLPSLVKDGIYVVLECFEKAKRNKPLLPLQCQGHYQVLYCSPLRSGDSRSPSPTSRWTTSNNQPILYGISQQSSSSFPQYKRATSPNLQLSSLSTEKADLPTSLAAKVTINTSKQTDYQMTSEQVLQVGGLSNDGTVKKPTNHYQMTSDQVLQVGGLSNDSTVKKPTNQPIRQPWTHFPFPLALNDITASNLSVFGKNFKSSSSSVGRTATTTMTQAKQLPNVLSRSSNTSFVTVFKPTLTADMLSKLPSAETCKPSSNVIGKEQFNQTNPSVPAATTCQMADNMAADQELPYITGAKGPSVATSNWCANPYVTRLFPTQSQTINASSSPSLSTVRKKSSEQVTQQKNIASQPTRNGMSHPPMSNYRTDSSSGLFSSSGRIANPTAIKETRPTGIPNTNCSPTTVSHGSLTNNSTDDRRSGTASSGQKQSLENPVIRMLKQLGTNTNTSSR